MGVMQQLGDPLSVWVGRGNAVIVMVDVVDKHAFHI